MPFKSDKQRRYMYANHPKIAERWSRYNKGGDVAPVPTGAPGAAQSAIDTYFAGGSPLVPRLSYEPGAAGADQASRIAYQKGLRELNEAGVDNAEDYIRQDWVVQDEPTQRGWDDWSQAERDRYLADGTSGHLIARDGREDWQRGVKFQDNSDLFYKDMAHRDANGLSVPGVGSALAGGIGGMMRGKMKAAVEAGGIPVAINGQWAVVSPDGTVIGNTGALGAHGVRNLAVERGLIAKPTGGLLGGLFGKLGDVLGAKSEADAKAAEEAAALAARQKQLDYYAQASNRGGHDYSHESDDDFRDRTANQYSLDHSTASDADLEAAYGGIDDWGTGYNTGGAVMDDDDVWGADPLAAPRETVDYGQTHPGYAAVQLPQKKENEILNYAKQAGLKAAGSYILPGPLGGATGSGWLGLNAGGWVGRRAVYLNQGGMAMPQAEMQAYNEMQSMTGPDPVGADFMMPQGSPEPEQYTPANDYGYIPSGGQTYKEQMEADKMYIQREKAQQDEDRKERAFNMGEQRKQEAHQKAMAQKDEAHAESMKQKRAGPLAQGG